MKKSLPFFLHLIPSIVIVTIITTVLLAVSTYKDFENLYQQQVEEELFQQAQLFAHLLPARASNPLNIDSIANVVGAHTQVRYTVITRDGEVLGDSDEKPEVMNNHKSRPEILQALMGEKGVSIRYSATLDRDYMYLAIPHDSLILRCSLPLKQINKLLTSFKSQTFQALLASLLLAIFLGSFVARRMSRPLVKLKAQSLKLAQGDFSYHTPIKGSSEIVDLDQTMEATAKELNKRFQQVQNQRERLRTLLRGMIEGVVAFDNEEKIYLINDSAATLFGMTKEQANGMMIQEAMRNVPLQKLVHALLDPTSDTRITQEIDISVGATSHTLTVQGTRLENDRGCLLVMHDITEVKRLENLRKDFAGNVSHELRTPLTVIKGFVETLEDGALEDEKIARHFLSIIHEQVDRLNDLIENLLKISQLEKESEESSVLLIEEPLSPLLTRIVHEKQASAAAKKCSLLLTQESVTIDTETDTNTATETTIEAPINSSLLEQAVVNLVDNAVKYSPDGSTISVHLTNAQEFVLIEVTDNGSGIAPEHLSRLFERFYRVDTGRDRSIGGTGLGLSIVKHIMAIHNGSVQVASEIGVGSTFTLTLPKAIQQTSATTITDQTPTNSKKDLS